MGQYGEWLRRKGAMEADGFISVGGLVHRLTANVDDRAPNNHSVFGKLIELRRVQLGLSTTDIAKKLGLDAEGVLDIERGGAELEPRTVHYLSEYLQLPQSKLMELAGLIKMRDSALQKNATRFVAKSERIGMLSQQEREALEEFVKYLADV